MPEDDDNKLGIVTEGTEVAEAFPAPCDNENVGPFVGKGDEATNAEDTVELEPDVVRDENIGVEDVLNDEALDKENAGREGAEVTPDVLGKENAGADNA